MLTERQILMRQKRAWEIEEDKAQKEQYELYEYVRDFAKIKADIEEHETDNVDRTRYYDVIKLADAAYIINMHNNKPDSDKSEWNAYTFLKEFVKSFSACRMLIHDHPLQYYESSGKAEHTAHLALLRQMQKFDIDKTLKTKEIQTQIEDIFKMRRSFDKTFDNFQDFTFRSPDISGLEMLLDLQKCTGYLIENDLPPLVDYGIPKKIEMLYGIRDYFKTEVPKGIKLSTNAYDTKEMNKIYRKASLHLQTLNWTLDIPDSIRREKM